MINVSKQILYWQTGADEELLNATIMIENKRFLAGLFFCHLCIEKMLKANVVKLTENHPSRTHNLFWLADAARIDFNEEQDKFVSTLQVYQLEGRYPETYPSEPAAIDAEKLFVQTKNLYIWLKEKL